MSAGENRTVKRKTGEESERRETAASYGHLHQFQGWGHNSYETVS